MGQFPWDGQLWNELNKRGPSLRNSILSYCCYKNFALFHKKLFIHSHTPFFVLFQARKPPSINDFPIVLLGNAGGKK